MIPWTTGSPSSCIVPGFEIEDNRYIVIQTNARQSRQTLEPVGRCLSVRVVD